MSEDYKKIAFEDVKEGQRVRIVERYPSHIAMYEGAVLKTRLDRGEIDLGEEVGDEVTVFVEAEEFYILLLEDAPKPKVVRTEKVTITHYDDGTTTQAPVEEEVRTPTAINTMEQFEEYEDYLKQVILKDREGDYWAYLDGWWCWAFRSSSSSRRAVFTSAGSETIARNLPLTVVENVGD